MTSEQDAAGLIQSIAENAKRLGLSWDITMATVADGDNAGSLAAVFDADADSGAQTLGLISMIGAVAPGARVYVMTVPPAGNYIVGLVQPGRFYARQTLDSAQGSVIFNIPPNLRELQVGWSAASTAAPNFTNMRMRLNGNATGVYVTENTTGAGAATASALSDNLNVFAFVGQLGGAGSGNLHGTGKIWFQGLDLSGVRRQGWTWNNQVMTSGGIQNTGGGNITAIAPTRRLDLLPEAGIFVAGSDFYLEGVFS